MDARTMSTKPKATKPEGHRLQRILRLGEVIDVTGKPESSIYEGVAEGTFPAPIPLGARAVGWLEDELVEWQARQIARRDARQEKEVA
jgi:prophage regulatory protein